MTERNFKDYEPKWQKEWEESGVYRAKDPGELRMTNNESRNSKFYGLIEFPYPSGAGLHVGHPRSYTAIDAICRKKRMEGRNVLYPIGWDAFGLPTENYAIKNKVRPQDATAENIANFRRQLKSIGFGFDWSREVNTTDPGYYKWTQWQFLKFFNSWYDRLERCARPIKELPIPKHIEALGEQAVREYTDAHRMAYKATSEINWCPNCKIGLANEEAVGGACERCGGPVEKREKRQWMIRMTEYAERLIEDLKDVDYLEQIKTQQVNWIGRSEGAFINFETTSGHLVKVFTTRPDTLFGATYLVMSPEHALVTEWLHGALIENENDVVDYRRTTAAKTEIERANAEKAKTGVKLEGVEAKHPVTGETLPIWIADYVLAGYGTGAIMAVPAHDERDFAFAKEFELPIRQVALPTNLVVGIGCIIQTEDGKLLLQRRDKNTERYPGKVAPFGGGIEKNETALDAAMREIKEELGLGTKKTDYFYIGDLESHFEPGTFIRMFVIRTPHKSSLSAFEGESIVELTTDQAMASDEVTEFTKEALQLYKKRKVFVGEGESINSDFLDGLPTWKAKDDMISWLEEHEEGERAVTYKLRDWVFSRQRYWGEPIPIIHCESCGMVPAALPVLLPEVEHYEPTDSGESPLAAIRDWVETDCPTCGGKAERETDTMPNWAGSSWYFLRYTDPENDDALADPEKMKYWMPVDLYNGGMEHATLHLLYSRFWHKFLWDVGVVPKECGSEPYRVRRAHGLILAEGGEKMSKSKGNVVNPDDIVEKYGADVFRVYEMFMGPFDQPVPWDTNGIEGVRRFLDKVWNLCTNNEYRITNNDSNLETLYHQTVKKITEGIDNMQFNTCVSQLMILTNAFQDQGGVPESMQEGFLKILAPFAPHMAEELWRLLGRGESIHVSGWPSYDESKLVEETFELVVQVNGKVRARATVSSGISEEEARAKAMEAAAKWLEGKEPKQAIYVKGKLINFVL